MPRNRDFHFGFPHGRDNAYAAFTLVRRRSAFDWGLTWVQNRTTVLWLGLAVVLLLLGRYRRMAKMVVVCGSSRDFKHSSLRSVMLLAMAMIRMCV